MYTRLPDIDDTDLEEQMDKIMQSDARIPQHLALSIRQISTAEKMALGLNADWLLDESQHQLCDLKPKHGEYSAEIQSGIFLVQQLSPQGKAELAADLLMNDWEKGPIDDAPSTIIE